MKTEAQAEHERYLRLEYWKETRALALKAGNYECFRCKSKVHLQVHHKHYRSLGCELMGDLEVLCRRCHEKRHGIFGGKHVIIKLPPSYPDRRSRKWRVRSAKAKTATCCDCQRTLPRSSFSIKNRKNGAKIRGGRLRGFCKECEKIRAKQPKVKAPKPDFIRQYSQGNRVKCEVVPAEPIREPVGDGEPFDPNEDTPEDLDRAFSEAVYADH